jgi:hypothetical protein
MFMRVNCKCAHQVRPPQPVSGQSGGPAHAGDALPTTRHRALILWRSLGPRFRDAAFLK